ncbi:DNA polymerase III subunit gamma/tau [Bacillaceae bacterium Marseille-Q3522]|nr:DNA polymerase III subunit gamma/tau [Bacillaceae bacterium Marseille-Q3522]
MSYQALYRVWRPQSFIDVIGQEHVTKTLQNALLQEKISHAYLFSGPRGTGKTSAAKIFAKAVNCEKRQSGEPCNECASCKGIMDGTISDVIEIDAASNNGVEEIRDIRDKVKYAPSSVQYKVYIIDEVHMLSIGAFNALLKTLEEPPKHVIFILATTEPHKIPLTIISRCQRFDFKRITAKAIVERMKKIIHETNVECDEQALQVIARSAEGGMRDALSLLDQAISFSDEKVTLEDALTVTGAVGQAFLNKLARAMKEREVAKALECLEELLFLGKDPVRLLEDLIFYYRDMLLYKAAPSLEESLERVMPDDTFRLLSEETASSSIYSWIDQLNKAQQDMRWTNHPRIFLEVAIVKLCQGEGETEATQNLPDISGLLQKVERLEKELQDLKRHEAAVVEHHQEAPQRKRQRSTKQGYKAPVGRIHEILKHATKEDLVRIKSQWGELLSKLMRSQAALLNGAEPVAAAKNAFILKFKYEIHCQMAMENQQFMETILSIVETRFGEKMQLIGVPEDQWQQIRGDFLQHMQHSESADVKTEKEEPIVAEAIKLFGADIVEIKE